MSALLSSVSPSVRQSVLLLAIIAPHTLTAQARLPVPQAVQERAPTTARDDAEIVKYIEHKIKCTCGCNLDVFTCRTTDFTCTTSPAMHRMVLARLDSSMTKDQVVAAFEAQYGQSVLMEPPKRGFNWTAYIMPFVGLGFGLALVTALMKRWVKSAKSDQMVKMVKMVGPDGSSDSTISTIPTISTVDADRLKHELERFET